jgi:hypothetical protein
MIMAAKWTNFEMPKYDGNNWYASIEPEMTGPLLNRLTSELTEALASCPK